MDNYSVKQLKSWVRRKLEDLRSEMNKEIQRKITDLGEELAVCARLQKEQIYTLLQMQTHTREMAVKNLQNNNTSEMGGDLLQLVDRTKTAEERKKGEDEALLLAVRRMEKEDGQRSGRKMNQEMDSLSNVRTEEKEIKREKERQMAKQKKEMEKIKRLREEKMKEKKRMMKEKRKEEMQNIKEEKRKQLEEEKRKEDELQRELEEKRKEERKRELEKKRKEKEQKRELEDVLRIEEDRRKRLEEEERKAEMLKREEEQRRQKEEEKKRRMIEERQRKEKEWMEMQRMRRAEEDKRQKEREEGKVRQQIMEMNKRMTEKDEREKVYERMNRMWKEHCRRLGQSDISMSEDSVMSSMEAEHLYLSKEPKAEEQSTPEASEVLMDERKEEEDEKRQKDSSKENSDVQMNSGADQWETEEEENNSVPALQQSTQKCPPETSKVHEEKTNMLESEKTSEEKSKKPKLGFGCMMKFMKKTYQKVVNHSVQNGKNNFEESRRQCMKKPHEETVQAVNMPHCKPAQKPFHGNAKLLHHRQGFSNHLKGAFLPFPRPSHGLRPGGAHFHPHSAVKRSSAS